MGNCACFIDDKKESKNEDTVSYSKTNANSLQLPISNKNKDKTNVDADASSYQLPRTTNLNPSVTMNLSYDTKRAMAWAHFLCDIWHRHINITHKCEFLNENDNM
eukprot:247984_1